jgi:hypothetical protein
MPNYYQSSSHKILYSATMLFYIGILNIHSDLYVSQMQAIAPYRAIQKEGNTLTCFLWSKPVSQQSRDIQLLGKLSKFVCNWRGKVFRTAAAARGDRHKDDSTAKGVLYPEHCLPWRRWPKTLSRVNYKQTLTVFLTIVVYRVIVGSLVTSL